MREELRECPFCNGTDLEKMAFLDLVGWMYWVECKYCRYVRAVSMADIDDAIKKWNTRPAEDALKAEVERLKGVLRSILQNAEFWDDEDDSLAIIHKLASEALNTSPGADVWRKD